MATFTVRGHRVRSASMRRFIVVKVTTDKWAVMDEVEHRTITGGSFTSHAVAKRANGFRAIFDTEAEAERERTGSQIVKVWSKAGAEVVKRSDSVATANRHANEVGGIVIDTTTGEEV